MVITNDVLLGMVLGVMLTIAVQLVQRSSRQLSRPGCVIPVLLVVFCLVLVMLNQA